MFIDHTNRRVLDVIEGRDKHLIVNYLRTHKGGLFAELEEVTCDMWDAYANATAEVFGDKVRVTIDRFHVMKNFQEHLTEARREIQRGLGKEEAKELKGTRWLWQTNPENLTDEQREQLAQLKERFPRLKELVEQLELYASSNCSSPSELVRIWERLQPYRVTVPLECSPLAARFFVSSIRTALAILQSRQLRAHREALSALPDR